ncbi:MAG: hypothetical protein P2A85_15715 [Microcoleus anatoxicus]
MLPSPSASEQLDALKTYLASREDLKDVAESMLGGREQVLIEF